MITSLNISTPKLINFFCLNTTLRVCMTNCTPVLRLKSICIHNRIHKWNSLAFWHCPYLHQWPTTMKASQATPIALIFVVCPGISDAYIPLSWTQFDFLKNLIHRGNYSLILRKFFRIFAFKTINYGCSNRKIW